MPRSAVVSRRNSPTGRASFMANLSSMSSLFKPLIERAMRDADKPASKKKVQAKVKAEKHAGK